MTSNAVRYLFPVFSNPFVGLDFNGRKAMTSGLHAPDPQAMTLDDCGINKGQILDSGWFEETSVVHADAMMLDDGFGDGLLSSKGQEMIATCTTCPAFSMCNNQTKLRPTSVENRTLVINYGLKNNLENDLEK